MARYFDVVLDEGAYMPAKAHEADAGWDLRTPVRYAGRNLNTIDKGESMAVYTGLHVQIPEGYYMSVENRSGLNVKHGITLHGSGIIDSGYTGSICVKLYNDGPDSYTVKPGDKIAQLIIHPFTNDIEWLEVDSLEETARGNNGFGSSGR